MDCEPATEQSTPTPQAFWDATALHMMSRRAYRRYHGQHKSSVTLQDWGTVVLLVILWGFYALRAGSIEAVLLSPDEEDVFLGINRDGMILTFAWAYTDESRAWGAFLVFLLVLIITYLVIMYQKRLEMKGSAWVTIITVLLMLGLAIDAGLQSSYADKNLLERQVLMNIWTAIQIVMLIVGAIRKVLIPWLAQREKIPPPKLLQARLQAGAAGDRLEEVWKRVPNLRERLLAEHAASNTPIFSFTGEYKAGRSTERVTYIGGLDGNAAPHGLGAWHDTQEDGELLVGRFMNGVPVAPYRVRTNKRSSFVSVPITVWSCRADSVRAAGSLTAVFGSRAANGGTAPVPLQLGKAYVECNTSGIFYKAFPRVRWLQLPAPIADPNGAQPPRDQPPTDSELACTANIVDIGALDMSFAATRVSPQHEGAPLATGGVSVGDKREPQWVPQLIKPSSENLMNANVATAAAPAKGYEALFYLHGFNCSVEHSMHSLGQLLTLGSFPSHIQVYIFAWPCTTGPFYPFGHYVTLSDYLSGQMIDALQRLRADGCRTVHMFGHSMGARVVAAASDKLAHFFEKLPEASAPEPSEVPTDVATKSAKMHLKSVTFLSPDMDTGEFVGHCGPILRSICPLITIYGDTRDSALDISVISNSMMFRWFPDAAPPGLKQETEKLGIPISACLGQHCNTLTNSNGDVLDVDYIATSHLSSNVHGLRHSYFHLNREMVDDIRDVITTGKRAADRPYRLEWTEPNTYGFLVAPNHVMAA